MEEEAPKVRYTRLQQVFDTALRQSLSKFQNWSKLSACFPTMAGTTEGKLHLLNCQKQVTEYWTQLSKREFQEILEERNVRAKLDKLDELIHIAEKRYADQDSNNNNPSSSSEIPLNELTTDRLLSCNAHTQRVKQMHELESRYNKVLQLNKSLETEIAQLEQNVNNDLQITQDMYKEFLGESAMNPPDKDLEESLNGMIVQELEFFK